MKQFKLLWFPLFMYMTLFSYTDVYSQSKITGSWICEIPANSSDERYENSYLWKLKIEKDETFLFGEGYKRIFAYEDRVGVYVIAEKKGKYDFKDSMLTLTFNNTPASFDYGPIFTPDHGKFTRNFASTELFPSLIDKLKKTTNNWIEGDTQKPLEITIHTINDQQLFVTWEYIDNDGKTNLAERTFNKSIQNTF